MGIKIRWPKPHKILDKIKKPKLPIKIEVDKDGIEIKK